MPGVIDVNTFFGMDRHRDVAWSLDELLRLLDQHHVDRALTCSLRGVHYDFLAGNVETRAATRQHPHLIAVATLDPRRYLDCREEALRCLGEGLRLFRFFPDVQGWPVDGLHFLRLVEVIAAGGGALLLPGAAGGGPSLAARVLGDFGLPVVLLGAGYSVFGELLAALVTCDNLYCDVHGLNTPGSCELICREAGEGRLMLGSGLPERYFSSAYLLVQRAGLSQSQREAILGGNAARVLLGEEM